MPFKSEAQRRLFHAKAARGEISKETVHEWEHATKNKKDLPMHVKKHAEELEAAFIKGAQAQFAKQADYADSLANLLEHVSPAKASLGARLAGGLAGGALGAGGMGLAFHHDSKLPGPVTRALEATLVPGIAGAAAAKHLGLANPGIKGVVGAGLLGSLGMSGAAGAAGGVHLADALAKRQRAATIRKFLPKAGLGLGAAATAALLAKHLLSKKRDDE